ncbi:MAG TPA: transcriptional regulator NrdR [Legionellales bacterium]|jgi:transcriptional repressor NrdR|nr:transcriptional regulator NrdR [Legionellales bacterium]
MYCPFCYAEDTKVVDSRLVAQGEQVKRRRECLICQQRFTTFETAELVLPMVIKRDGRRENFHLEKLKSGMQTALEKRPVSVDIIEDSIAQVLQKIRRSGEREIESRQIGEWIMQELYHIDHVAYVRFASVYKRFKDISEFREALEQMKDK